MAAVVQLCAGADVCYLFMVHAFTEMPKSFFRLFDDPDIPMVCVEPGHDVNYLSRRFQSLSWRAPPSFSGVIDICRIYSALSSRPRSLGDLTLSYTGRAMRKYIDHRFWESIPLTPHQIAYASNDAFAHLTTAACSTSCICDEDGFLTLQVVVRSNDFQVKKNTSGELTVVSLSLSCSTVLQKDDILCTVSTVGFSAKVLASSIIVRASPSFAAARLSDISQHTIIKFDCRRLVASQDRGAVTFLRLAGDKGWVTFTDERSGAALLQILLPEKTDSADDMIDALESVTDTVLCIMVKRPKVVIASKIGAQNRSATYRHEKNPSKRVVDKIVIECDPEMLGDDSDEDDSDGDDSDGDENDADSISGTEPKQVPPKRPRPLSGKIARKSAATDEAVAAAMSAILSYVMSERRDDLTLTTKFSSEDRKVLHSFCSDYGLFHRSFGPEGDRAVRLSF